MLGPRHVPCRHPPGRRSWCCCSAGGRVCAKGVQSKEPSVLTAADRSHSARVRLCMRAGHPHGVKKTRSASRRALVHGAGRDRRPSWSRRGVRTAFRT
eukprot:5110838-Prymnesium_polylepis.1